MANKGEFIELVSPEAIKQIKDIVSLINQGADGVVRLNAEFAKVKTPSGNKSVISGINNEIQRSQVVIDRQRIAEIQLQKQREANVDRFVKNEQKAQQALERSETAYQRIQSSVNILTKTYQDLAIRKELGSTLTKREEGQLVSLTSRLNTYQSALKKVDADIQKNQRNVGNYASGWNGLGNSINQITRELPAFTFSAQTGFLALSNNIPILTDEIGKLQRANKELIAQGQPVKSVFSQILGAVFSLQTVMGVGILLFTLYGKEISDFVSTLFTGAKAFNAMKEAQKSMNASTLEGTKNAQQELLQLRSNLAIAKDVNLSYKDRSIAVDNLLKQYPYYFENLTKEQILAGKTADAENALTEAILSRAKAQAATSKIVENQSTIIDLEERRLVIQKQIAEQDARNPGLEKRAIAELKTTSDRNYALERYNSGVQISLSLRNSLKNIDEEIAGINEVNNRLTSYALSNQKKAIGLDYQQDKSKEKVVKRKKEEAVMDEIQIKGIDSLISSMQYQIRLSEQLRDALSRNGDEYREYDKKVQRLKLSLLSVTDLQKALGDSGETVAEKLKKQGEETERAAQKVIELEVATSNFLESIGANYFSDLGFSSLNFFTQIQDNGITAFEELMAGADELGEKIALTLKGVGDVAKDVFAFMNQQQTAYFDAQYERLAKEKDLALEFAGESATGRAEIERQYEERRKEIDRKKAKAQKETALFNAIVNVAQAVTAFLAEANYPGAILAGVLGAAQIAIISNTQVPEYALGTDFHGGGMALVGDGGKHEVVYQPSSGFSITPKNDTLVDLERGSKVYPDINSFLKNSGAMLGGVPNIELENSGLSASEMDSILGKYFSNITTQHTTIDKNGLNSYINTKSNSMKLLNNRVSGKGFPV